ncbi:SDR family oxidoreductase [Dietzia natronolimnaea]|uniref:SDR family oxidoreductase n=1 Tax=Dietzia natronolimnaea TaxID=161920 RepID=UPI0015FD284F|nr:SDR family oxidoreductase [Dietzia natronolimnaea]MBB1036882.1 SDR family oxidoreductase [Dietzia natronolimnaea]
MSTGMFDISGKHVLVTGGARGIGRMIVESLLRRGVTVYLSTRKEEAATQAARELGELGEVHAFAVDIGTEDGCHELVDRVSAHTHRLHGLINNAGATWGAAFDEFPDAAWDKVLGVNVKAPFTLAKAARSLLGAAALGSDGGGPARVINIGSIDGLLVPNYENYSYSAAKAAIHHLTRHMASTLAPSILVNAIAPGPFPTKMMEWVLDERGDEISGSNPLKRLGRADDVDGLVTFLLSDASSYITGTVIPLDGGLTATASAALFVEES